ncbi:MAG TPA: ABC transporter permease [Symbiobacteriaceae bacterium]|nr:ABC transporter permease [Symbiobacteriaceae bacterium]
MAEPVKQIDKQEDYSVTKTVESPMRIFWKRLRAHRPSMFSLVILFVIVLLAVLAPYVTVFDPEKVDLSLKFAPPFTRTADGHIMIFGGDNLGRDVFTRAWYGARVSLMVGFLAEGLGIVLGAILGAISGYYGGWVDTILMRIVDIFLSIPTLILLITVMAVYGPLVPKGGEKYLIVLVLGILGWQGTARLVRGEILSLKERDFVEAARGLGAKDRRIIFKHILPNVMAPIIVSVTLGVSGAILSEASLSYLGVGIQPPVPSWGNMIQSGQNYLRNAWWITAFPGAVLCLTTLALYMLGDGLREALDPRLKK